MKKRVITLLTVVALTMTACGSKDAVSISDLQELIEENEELKEENEKLREELSELKGDDSYEDSVVMDEEEVSESTEFEDFKVETKGVMGNDIRWEYGNGILLVKGSGDMTDYENARDIPWYDIKDKVGHIYIEKGITSIGNKAFYDFKYASKVVIPETVSRIGDAAFDGCQSLKKIEIPSELTYVGKLALNTGQSETAEAAASTTEEAVDATYVKVKYQYWEKITYGDCEIVWRGISFFDNDTLCEALHKECGAVEQKEDYRMVRADQYTPDMGEIIEE